MDYGLIKLMLRDHDSAQHDLKSFYVFNTVKKFGKETEYEEIKVILRKYYRELKTTFGDKGKRIEGAITDKRLREIVDHLEYMIHEYYFLNRFK